MPARDKFHETVKRALEKDGWTITADPYKLQWGLNTLYVDLAAEKVIAAEKNDLKIAVEVKSFLGHSETADLENALGQYLLYYLVMQQQDPQRILYLAVPETIFREVFGGIRGEILLSDERIKVFGYAAEKEEIIGWKN